MAKAKKKKKDIAASYDAPKDYKGQQYTGMAIGRTHHWHYDQGDWKEKKITPDKWELTFATTKRRVGHAPEGSGVPVGTGYHWFILAHQYVEKLNANDYSTQMSGLKFKLAHKRAAKGTWSVSNEKQRKELVDILKTLIADLERDPEQMSPVALELERQGQVYTGTAIPILTSCVGGVCQRFDVSLNNEHIGIMRHSGDQWKITEMKQGLATAVGRQIEEKYKR